MTQGKGRAIALALLFTAAGVLKPLHIDDTAYFLFARQIAAAPFDPYGFWIFWVDRPEPAMSILAPPVFPYYWALLLKLFGESPLLWKLGCFPIYWLYIASLDSILKRLAPSLAPSLLVMITLSPMVFPGANLMLELPVQALLCASLGCFLLACERQSWGLVMLSGLLSALCMETKYTGLVAPALLLLWGLTHGRSDFGPAAAFIGALCFGAIEGAIALASGHSHFLVHAFNRSNDPEWLDLARGLVGQLGSGGVGLLGLVSIGLFRRGLVTACLLFLWLAAFTLACLTEPSVARRLFRLLDVATGALVVIVVSTVAVLESRRAVRNRDSASLFLTLWLAIEIVFYFSAAPFPAMRRVIGLGTVSSLILGRWLQVSGRRPRRALAAAVAASLFVSAAFYVVDLQWAKDIEESVDWAQSRAGTLEPDQTFWYDGIWGFKYYAMRSGMQAFVIGESQPRPGDYLVYPDAGIATPSSRPGLSGWREIGSYERTPMFGLKTSGYYYGFYSLMKGKGPMVRVRLMEKL